MAAVSSSSASASSPLPISWLLSSPNCCYYFNSHSLFYQSPSRRFQIRPISASHVCIPHKVDKSSLIIAVTEAEDQLWAASCLHVRSFHDFQPSTYGVQVEHVIREQNVLAANEFIELFCELVVARLAIIAKQRECQADLKEGIASLIFAAPRCAEIPELMALVKIFEKKYGIDFVSAATDLRPNAGVNRIVSSQHFCSFKLNHFL